MFYMWPNIPSLDPKHPCRLLKVCQCRTVERSGCTSCTTCFGNVKKGKGRLEGVIDLHAADAQYNVSCYKDFTAPRNVKYAAKKKQTDLSECTTDDSFDSLIIKMTEDPSHMWTSIELHELYRNENGEQSRKSILEKLKLHFGKDLVVMHIQGCASLACFKNHIPFGGM